MVWEMMTHSIFLRTAIRAIQIAHKLVLNYYRPDVVWRLKDDLSPVTAADTAAQDAIIQYISSKFPDHHFLAEEGYERPRSCEYLWIIDPIDGTKNYLRNIPLFTTEIALLRNNELLLGVSNAPILGELVYAERGGGAYCSEKRIHVSSVNRLDEAYLSFGNLKHFVNCGRLTGLVDLASAARNPRGIGDAWSFHLLAQGKIDIMVDAYTRIWDIAALTVIIEEAGGKVTDIDGNPISIESTSVIATNGKLHETVLKSL